MVEQKKVMVNDMIEIHSIPMPLGFTHEDLVAKVATILQTSPSQLQKVTLTRQSIDARKKSNLHYVCGAAVEAENQEALVAQCSSNQVSLKTPTPYVFPAVARTTGTKPVVVGMGPAGLFAALYLARHGIPSIVLERGRPVEERTRDVMNFWKHGDLNPSSNVQFGEGGAGTFSDGKLTTGTHDSRIATVLKTLADAGAPEDILYQQKPHIGTDILRNVVVTLRKELVALGCDVRFSHQLTALQSQENTLQSITVSSPQGDYTLPCDTLILAPGHSARDTFSAIYESGAPMAPKSFAIGVRIEHPQSAISASQFGEMWKSLPAADYKLSCHLPSGRSAFSFCVCPGGQVVAAASEEGHLVTNGMSHRARDGRFCNGGFLVGVTPDDFPSDHPLAGVDFQAHWEKAAFALGGSTYHAPAQRVGDFLQGVPSQFDHHNTTYRPGVVGADLSQCLPNFVVDTLKEALPIFGKKIRGFDHPNATLIGIETRSSSPVRILRGTDFQSDLRGLYPCGEGAGYAGGIMSAAVDGIKIAEAVACYSNL